jgi:hypothetical protein
MVFERQADRLTRRALRVLIVGGSARGFFGLVRRLQEWGCQCSIADSQETAARLFLEQGFGLVLAVDYQHRLGTEFLAALAGSSANLFRAFPVEDSCWWLPVLRQGRECADGRALRPAEFARLVERMASETSARAAGQAGSRQPA